MSKATLKDQPANKVVTPLVDDIITETANKYGLERNMFWQTIKTVRLKGENVSDHHVIAFLEVAKKYDLDPFVGELHGFVKGGAVFPIVGVDGWSTLVNRNPDADGFELTDGTDPERGYYVECRMWRRSRNRPGIIREYLNECKRDTQPWKQWPTRMLRHKAYIQCARLTYGLTGIYELDEVERMVSLGRVGELVDIETSMIAPKPPKVSRASKLAQELGEGTAEPISPLSANGGEQGEDQDQPPETGGEAEESDIGFAESEEPPVSDPGPDSEPVELFPLPDDPTNGAIPEKKKRLRPSGPKAISKADEIWGWAMEMYAGDEVSAARECQRWFKQPQPVNRERITLFVEAGINLAWQFGRTAYAAWKKKEF